jgi:hypothetical protein
MGKEGMDIVKGVMSWFILMGNRKHFGGGTRRTSLRNTSVPRNSGWEPLG